MPVDHPPVVGRVDPAGARAGGHAELGGGAFARPAPGLPVQRRMVVAPHSASVTRSAACLERNGPSHHKPAAGRRCVPG